MVKTANSQFHNDFCIQNEPFGSSGGLRVTLAWKWLQGHRFGMENGRFGNSGGLLSDLGLEMAPRASFWHVK